ncbi:MAG: hypothetical protein M3388_18670 [Acidobacteriota bacterium]|nr:hypothetical protein [Acidobacteriota bacterium]
MNTFLFKQKFSFLLMASFLLSFWICIENCRAEAEHNSEISRAALQNVQVEKTEKDSCSVQTAPSAFSSNQELFVASSASLSNRSWKEIARQTFSPFRSFQTEKSFAQLPFQILRQMRV